MKRPLFKAWRLWPACALCVGLAGCATYHAKPLPVAPDLASRPALTVPARQFQLPGLSPHPIPFDGLDQITVVMLAVYNNPALKAARLQADVASAQMLQAGLLPNPQLSAGYAQSARNYGGALGLSEDIQALITHGATKAIASAAQKQVHLNILWQEWQVAGQADQLFIQARSNEQLERVLRAKKRLLATRYRADLKAMQRGDDTATVVSSDLMQLLNAQDSLRQLQTSINLTGHQLNELLGLQPDVHLRLIGSPSLPPLTAGQFHSAMAALPHRRADLLELQAGYQSQEERVRKAILMQFPAMSAGLNLERDPVEGVNDFGPAVNLSLPIFNHNQGQIEIQRATRTYLRQTYQARLDAAVNQADELWKANRILANQLHNLDAQLPFLRRRAEAARQSLLENNLDAPAYVLMEENYLAKQQESIRLRAALESSRSNLRLLLGLPISVE